MSTGGTSNPGIWIVILMGVSGSGKTTIGRLLARDLGWEFYEGDDFHPASNIEKMGRGIPLDDTDRMPWLEAIRKLIRDLLGRSQRAVITCSALKQGYRESLTEGQPRVSLVYLRGHYALIRERLEARTTHFMKADLLASQFRALDEPRDIPSVNIAQAPSFIVGQIKRRLALAPV